MSDDGIERIGTEDPGQFASRHLAVLLRESPTAAAMLDETGLREFVEVLCRRVAIETAEYAEDRLVSECALPLIESLCRPEVNDDMRAAEVAALRENTTCIRLGITPESG